MCLAIPMKITKIEGNIALADVGGVTYQASLDLMANAEIGDYIIVHAGFAIQKLDEAAALESLAIWQDVANFNPDRSHS